MLHLVELLPRIGIYIRFLIKRILLGQRITVKELPVKTIDYAIGCGLVLLVLVLLTRLCPGLLRWAFQHDYKIQN